MIRARLVTNSTALWQVGPSNPDTYTGNTGTYWSVSNLPHQSLLHQNLLHQNLPHQNTYQPLQQLDFKDCHNPTGVGLGVLVSAKVLVTSFSLHFGVYYALSVISA